MSSCIFGGAQDTMDQYIYLFAKLGNLNISSRSFTFAILADFHLRFSHSFIVTFATMPSMRKSQSSRIPFYFNARIQARSRHNPSLTTHSPSQQLDTEQTEDLRAQDLLPADLRGLKRDLELYNDIGRIVTFNRTIKDWVVWDRCVLFFLTPGNISYALLLGLAAHSKPNLESLRLWLPVGSTKSLILYFPSALMHITTGALRTNAEWNVTVKRLQEVNGGSFVLANMTATSKVCQLVSGINKPHLIVNLV
jgi:hypothetical protein